MIGINRIYLIDNNNSHMIITIIRLINLDCSLVFFSSVPSLISLITISVDFDNGSQRLNPPNYVSICVRSGGDEDEFGGIIP